MNKLRSIFPLRLVSSEASYWTFLISVILLIMPSPFTAFAKVGWICPDEPAGAPLYRTLDACRNSPCPSNCVAGDNTADFAQVGWICPDEPAGAPLYRTPEACRDSPCPSNCVKSGNTTEPVTTTPPPTTTTSPPPSPSGEVFKNPISANTFADLVNDLANAVRDITIPIVVIFLLYGGFLFVTARGNETKLTTAKKTFYWTIIGAVVVIGASALAQAAVNFARSLGGP